ncbi:hypothetical protein N9V96_02510 [Polaribacter sp.]|nr:hypothetical protein [Polaribacter sp.]
MKVKTIFFLLTVTFFISCEINEETTIDADNLLLGNWTDAIYNANDETTTFYKTDNFPDEKYAISFEQNTTFLENTSGWCATPPLVFSTVKGSFSLQEDIIAINSNNYPDNYAWRIVSLTETELVVKREYTEQEKEHRAMMDLFVEISNLAYGASCDNISDWSYTAFGSKACGGPQGYLPYSKNIDVTDFLEKVAIYTETEKAYNIKWGVISTCDLPTEPKSVECSYGYPALKY